MTPIDTLKRWVPRFAKDMIKEQLARRRFAAAFARYAEATAAAEPTAALMDELVEAWDNQGYSARTEYLLEVVRAVRSAGGPILECGSGLSTLIVGLEASRRNLELHSLEHEPAWVEIMTRRLGRAGISTVHLCHAPLKSYPDFDWYDPPLERLPRDFALVICDGPPGHGRGGRVGLVDVMRAHLRPGCAILLDDYERREEQAAAARWVRDTGARVEARGSQKPYAVIELP